jgi:predicted TIM-barrel fold metal-dependent hydrolase
VYERAAAHNLFCLFHTGVFTLPEPLPSLRVSSARCRPIMLDPIANAFPSLRMIIAHLGVCWGEEAATLCRIQPNIYADLSGSIAGWRVPKSSQWWREMLYWPTAHRKILFGSDVHYRELKAAIEDQTRALAEIGWTREQLDHLQHRNAASLLAG